MQIKLDDINLDPSTQSRAAINQEIVDEYQTIFETNPQAFPPVELFSEDLNREKAYIGDGWHRVLAANQAGAKTIEANVHVGNKRTAILYAIGSNAKHGMRRKPGDKNKAVNILLADKEWGQWSSNYIAKAACVSHTFVNNLRNRLTSNVASQSRKGEDGRSIDTAKIGKTSEAVEFIPPKNKTKQRGKSLFPRLRKIISRAQHTISKDELPWGDHAPLLSHYVSLILDRAIAAKGDEILEYAHMICDEICAQIQNGKIKKKGRFLPEIIDVQWENMERFIETEGMDKIIEGVKKDMKKKQGEMFE